jgi:hypothetical protein
MTVKGIVQRDEAEAEAERIDYQNRIEAAAVGASLVAKKWNLERYAAGIIPVARDAEFEAGDAEIKLRFGLVVQRTFQAEGVEGDYLTVFEIEYAKEFG